MTFKFLADPAAWDEEPDVVLLCTSIATTEAVLRSYASDGTLQTIAARLVALKPGARVIHMTEHFLRDDDAFERVAEDPIPVEMSFGVTGVFVARRRGASE